MQFVLLQLKIFLRVMEPMREGRFSRDKDFLWKVPPKHVPVITFETRGVRAGLASICKTRDASIVAAGC
jgi:hypothetical protein